MKNKKIILWSIILIVFPFIVSLFLLLFKINVFKTPEFWSGYFSLFGAIVLGAVAIYQNNKAFEQANQADIISRQANDISNRLLALEERQYLPILDISRRGTLIKKIDDHTVNIRLSISNLTNYPIHNIFMTFKPLSNNEIRYYYLKGGFFDEVVNNDKDIKKSENLLIAGLRGITVFPSTSNQSPEPKFNKDFDYLIFNYQINDEEHIKIEFFIYMQNVEGEIFLQKTIIFISKIKNDYYYSMHSKTIKKIEIEDNENG